VRIRVGDGSSLDLLDEEFRFVVEEPPEGRVIHLLLVVLLGEEGRESAQQDVRHHAQRPHIALRGDWLSLEDLWRLISESAHHGHFCIRQALHIHRLRKPKIQQLDVLRILITHKHDILRLQITMRNTLTM